MIGLVIVIALALLFDFVNGFHDAANSIATVVSTRVLRPQVAVIWAAVFNFVAFLLFEPRVAATISKGVHADVVSLALIGSAILGAVGWSLLTWILALPTSSTHALLGGLGGAALVKAGFHALDQNVFFKTAVFIVASPLLGLVLASVIMRVVNAVFGSRPNRFVEALFRKAQLLSAALYSIGHGANDAQKTMGIIVAALLATGVMLPSPDGSVHVPLWVVLSCHAAMGLGTLFGGWRIVQTMGMRITKLAPAGGFSAEISGACALFLVTTMSIPVSSTHTITGAIVGAGSVRRWTAVRWGIASRIVWAWVFTVPGAALLSAACTLILRCFGIE